MVKIRKAKSHEQCISCTKKKARVKQLYEIGVGSSSNMTIVCLCDECMHALLQKLIIVGSEFNEIP